MTRFRRGLVGTLVLVAVMTAATQLGRLPFVSGGRTLSAYFTEVGNLQVGSPVLVSGATIGKVTGISITGSEVQVTFILNGSSVRLGTSTRAVISTLTLLGKAGLELDPSGAGDLPGGASIPQSRTSSPYDITAALAQLTNTTASIDVGQLSKALSTTAGTLTSTPADLDRALRGIAAVATSVSDNGGTVESLLSRTRALTDVLQGRNAQVATLLTSGSALLDALNTRQQMVVTLLDATTNLTAQLIQLIKDNRSALKPALASLNRVTALLNRNKLNLQKTIDGARDYAVEFGETLSSGPFFDGYIQNLTAPGTLTPILSGILK